MTQQARREEYAFALGLSSSVTDTVTQRKIVTIVRRRRSACTEGGNTGKFNVAAKRKRVQIPAVAE